MSDKTLNLLGMMRKAGALEIGEFNVGNVARTGKAKLLVVANDAGENAKRRISGFAMTYRIDLVELPFSREEFSQIIGKENSVMAAVVDQGFSKAFVKSLKENHPECEVVSSKNEKNKARDAQPNKGYRRNNA